MARSIKESVNLLKTSRDDIKTALKNKKQSPPENLKISAVATYIQKIETGLKVTLNIIAIGYNGETITATKGSKKYTGVVSGSTCDIEVDEEGIWTISTTDGNSTTIEVKCGFEGYISKFKIYGFEINPNESDPYKRVTYTDNAVGMTPARMDYLHETFNYGSWENIWFVADNHVYLFNGSSKTDQLKDTDYSKISSGGDSMYNSDQYDSLVSFPLCWIHRSQKEDGTRVVKISQVKIDDTYHAYGWEDENGNVQDYFYVGAYEGYYNSSQIMKSITDVKPNGWTTASTDLQYCSKQGSGFAPLDYCKVSAIQDLCVLISKSTDSQTAFGYGYSNSTSVKNTGELVKKGRFWGEQTGKKSAKVFHLENWWGNYLVRLAGLVMKTDGKLYIKTHGPYNINGTDYTALSEVPALTSRVTGFVTNGVETKYGFIGTKCSGSDSTYECDQQCYDKPSSGVYCAIMSSGYSGGFGEGVFNLDVSLDGTHTLPRKGTRLAYTPQGKTSNPSA